MRRSLSNAAVSIEMDYEELEQCLFRLASFASDSELLAVVHENFAGLASRCQMRDRKANSDELNEVANMFVWVLSSAPQLPARAVAQAHSFVGMIRTEQRRYDCAIQSFLKALWLQTSNEDTQVLDLAMTKHRLGCAYGETGNFPQAIKLLQKALEDYQRAKMRPDHTCCLAVQSALVGFRARHLHQTFENESKSNFEKYGSIRGLSHIQEDREYHSDPLYQQSFRPEVARW